MIEDENDGVMTAWDTDKLLTELVVANSCQ